MRLLDTLRTRAAQKGTYTALLIALLVLEVGIPVADMLQLQSTWPLELAFVLVLLASLSVAVERTKPLILLVVLFVVSSALGLAHHSGATTSTAVLLVAEAGRLAFLAIVSIVILRHVLQSGSVTLDKILGAVSVYLLVGIVFGLAFRILLRLEPASILMPEHFYEEGADAYAQFSVLQYFSFTTLTTLGYGDVIPLSPLARLLTQFESVLGQMYLAIIIARLVALHVVHPTEEHQPA